MKKIGVLAVIFSVIISSQARADSTDFAKKYCSGNCANQLLFDHDPADILTLDEHFLIQYYTESYNILDIKMFIEAVTKLPSSKTTVYRGTEKTTSGANHVGQVIQLQKIASTSADRYIAENFIRNQLLVIKTKSARSIVDYSAVGEQELILLPGTKLRVDKITKERIDLSSNTEQKIVDIEVVYMTEL